MIGHKSANVIPAQKCPFVCWSEAGCPGCGWIIGVLCLQRRMILRIPGEVLGAVLHLIAVSKEIMDN